MDWNICFAICRTLVLANHPALQIDHLKRFALSQRHHWPESVRKKGQNDGESGGEYMAVSTER